MVLPTKIELKNVSLETLTAYCEMLQEEIARRKTEERQKIADDIATLIKEALEVAQQNDINIFFKDKEQILHLDDFETVTTCNGSVSVEFR